MNITLTVCGDLEEDTALQEIVATLHRRTTETQGYAAMVAPKTKEPPIKPEPEPEAAKEAPVRKPAVENPGFAEAVDDMAAEAPAAKIAVADIQRAATKAMNANKRDGVMAALQAHGGALKDVPEADYPALLAEIEAL